jgi:DNA (cytosine-5)-methyltransferase 1
MSLTFGSVCSGIEAASVAWHPLGWRAAWLSEIATFPSALLKHHYPDVPNVGDMTKIADMVADQLIDAPDLFCGGTPCQSFSVSGLRKSLNDERGNLTLEFVRIADAIDDIRCKREQRPAIIFWENVPGVLNTADNAFGNFLGALAGESDALVPTGAGWGNAGIVVGPKRNVAWRILDAQYFGLAQRRKRVFVVASARTDIDVGQVLFEFGSMQRHTAPSRKKTQTFATDTKVSIDVSGQQTMIAHSAELSPTLTASGPPFSRTGAPNQELDAYVVMRQSLAFGIQGNIIGRQPQNGGGGLGIQEEIAPTLTTADKHVVATMPFSTVYNHNRPLLLSTEDMSPTLTGSREGHTVVYGLNGQKSNPTASIEIAHTLTVNTKEYVYEHELPYIVRRLTPVECERLQGFPDHYTAVPFNGKPSTDTVRYKALGNSWPINVVRWLGERIQMQIDASEAL